MGLTAKYYLLGGDAKQFSGFSLHKVKRKTGNRIDFASKLSLTYGGNVNY